MKAFKILALFALCAFSAQAQKAYQLASPDGKLKTTINTGTQLTYDITFNGQQVLQASPLSMTLDNGEVWGENDKPSKVTRKSVDGEIKSPFYRAEELDEEYNEMTLQFKGFNVVFRAYDDGIAYRFVNRTKKPFNVVDELVDYRFPTDATASVPYVKPRKGVNKYANSFENYYANVPLSKVDQEKLVFLPIVVSMDNNVKVCITEVDLENYPGLYLTGQGNTQLLGDFAPYPKKQEQGGHNMLQMNVLEVEDYIAKVDQPRNFPWRVAIVTDEDKELASSNLSYLLAEPSRLEDISWIKPGKIAWDWWNAWNLDGVDFETGVNNDTYKAYIDFASKNGIEYVILDEGWAVNLKADLMQVVPEINLEELIAYATKKNVGLVLWAGYHAFNRDMENVCRHYAEMGIKGFKVDFMDRDDQEMTDFNYRAAQMTAKYKLLLDLHGMYKPAGLNRTYPNAINFEGVNGLEQMKWEKNPTAQVEYDVMIPFIRQVAGPMDYTQGAMRNAAKGNYYPCYTEPMSQGTRCRQLALYVILESPFNMLCDTPSNYEREQECTDFISAIPTVWDETIVLDGKMGEYIITARRNGDTWYIGGLTNWTARDLEIDLSFLDDDKAYSGKLFKDGVNAHRIGRDYQSQAIQAKQNDKVKVHLAPGGGFALILK